MKHILKALILFTMILLLPACTDNKNNPDKPPRTFEDTKESSNQTLPEKTEIIDVTHQPDTTQPTDPTEEDKRNIINYKNMKAMWLSQFDLQNVYTNQGKQREIDDFSKRMDVVLENVQKNGFNTVILQVRPYADSFYPSEIYPPSRYVTGSYQNDFLYDPLPIIIEKAHNMGLSVHAWINPLRCMTTEEINSIDDKYTIKQWSKQYEGTYLVAFNGRYYLNPAYPMPRQLIVDGIEELLTRYRFDGLHMDDYFYPTTAESFDSTAYFSYKTEWGTLTLKQYRSENISTLVSSIYSTVKKIDRNIIYGISPEGNINNATDKAYADVYKWCSNEGYIDYICPQIYFGLEHQSWAFDKTANIWSDIIKNDDIDLIIGMTFGKALSKTDKWAGSGKDEWANNTDVMKRCLEFTSSLEKCKGVSVFCYQYYYDPISAKEVTETKTERDNFTAVLKNTEW